MRLRRAGRDGHGGSTRPPVADPVGDPVSVAAAVHRLAVLIHAGVAPLRAWQLVSDSGSLPRLSAADVRDDAALAARLAAVGGAWSEVAVLWRVASVVGAPLAESLRSIASALRDAGEAQDDVTVALAEPAATARLIAWLPLVAVLLVVAFGFDLTAMLVSPVGVGCAVGGAALMALARRWTAALVRRAQPEPGIAGWQCDALAIALSGGLSIDRALGVTEAAGCADVRASTTAILALSRQSGAPAVELLRAEAADRRRDARTEGRLRAARLSAGLLLPLGVCTLPAFLLLGVGPMLLSVLSSTPLVL